MQRILDILWGFFKLIFQVSIFILRSLYYIIFDEKDIEDFALTWEYQLHKEKEVADKMTMIEHLKASNLIEINEPTDTEEPGATT